MRTTKHIAIPIENNEHTDLCNKGLSQIIHGDL